MLRAANITVFRNGRAILDNVSCDIPSGKVTVILGPNGAGKSTLLKLFAGEFYANSGRVWLGGRELPHWRARDVAKRRAVLPQESSLTFPFRVDEVVLMGRAPHVRGAETSADHEIAAKALARVDMLSKRGRIFPSLSGGEKQRVHLARAMAQVWDPPAAAESPAVESAEDARNATESGRVLLLDEPTSSLDLQHQHGTLREARRLASEGVTVLAILHDLNLALAYADRIILLRDGRIHRAGTVDEALTPENIRQVFGVACQFLSVEGQSRPFVHVLPFMEDAVPV